MPPMDQIIYKEQMKAGLYKWNGYTYYMSNQQDGTTQPYKLPEGQDITQVAFQIIKQAIQIAETAEGGWDAPSCLVKRNIITLLKFTHDLELERIQDNPGSYYRFVMLQNSTFSFTSIATPARKSLQTPVSSAISTSLLSSSEEETSVDEDSFIEGSTLSNEVAEILEEDEILTPDQKLAQLKEDAIAKKYLKMLAEPALPSTPISSRQPKLILLPKLLFDVVAEITNSDKQDLINKVVKKIEGSRYLRGLVKRQQGDLPKHLEEIKKGKGSYIEILTLSILFKRAIYIRNANELLQVNGDFATAPIPLLYNGDGQYSVWKFTEDFELNSLLKGDGLEMLDPDKIDDIFIPKREQQ